MGHRRKVAFGIWNLLYRAGENEKDFSSAHWKHPWQGGSLWGKTAISCNLRTCKLSLPMHATVGSDSENSFSVVPWHNSAVNTLNGILTVRACESGFPQLYFWLLRLVLLLDLCELLVIDGKPLGGFKRAASNRSLRFSTSYMPASKYRPARHSEL